MLFASNWKKKRILMKQCSDVLKLWIHNSNRNYSKIEYVHEELLKGLLDYLEEGTLVYEMLKDFIIEKNLLIIFIKLKIW